MRCSDSRGRPFDETRAEIEELKALNGKLQADLKASDGKVSAAQARVDALVASEKALNGRLDEAKAAHALLEKESEKALSVSCSGWGCALTGLQAANVEKSRLRGENDALKTKLADLTKQSEESKSLSAEVAQLVAFTLFLTVPVEEAAGVVTGGRGEAEGGGVPTCCCGGLAGAGREGAPDVRDSEREADAGESMWVLLYCGCVTVSDLTKLHDLQSNVHRLQTLLRMAEITKLEEVHRA